MVCEGVHASVVRGTCAYNPS